MTGMVTVPILLTQRNVTRAPPASPGPQCLARSCLPHRPALALRTLQGLPERPCLPLTRLTLCLDSHCALVLRVGSGPGGLNWEAQAGPLHAREAKAQGRGAGAELSVTRRASWGPPRLRQPQTPLPNPSPRRFRLRSQRPGQIKIDCGEQLGRVEQTRAHRGVQGHRSMGMRRAERTLNLQLARPAGTPRTRGPGLLAATVGATRPH